MGRPRKTWTDAEVEQFPKLCGIFCTRKECASIMGVDVRTLDKLIAEHFPETPTWEEAFNYFSGVGKASLRRRQYEAAMDGSIPMLIFLGKNYLGQSDAGAKEEESAPKAKLAAFTSSAKFAKVQNG